MTHILSHARQGILVLALCTVAGMTAAQDSVHDDLPDPAPAIVLAEPDRAHLVNGVLYWQDYRLSAVCTSFAGQFAKLASSPVYFCAPSRLRLAQASE